MITNENKKRILEAIATNRTNYPSDAKHAASLGISTSVYSAIKNGQTDKARYYVQGHRNAIYVDCSQVKTKLKMVRKIATEFGVGSNGRYSDVYEDLVYYLRSIDTPLIILDEAGDLQYEAFLELKALWNATERCCAWYMMGADGLKAKINRSIECKKVGYTEMLSRYGDRYSKVTPDDCKEREKFLKDQASVVAKVNAPEGADIATLVRKSGGGLRRVYTEIEKLKRVQA
ncbi:ATP-binding protein [uncultured Prevotella sp.]|uniref:ATP-binding protein n=1 Tax=uncultured Prevotella sp. TaxID=159272 RepID=UPI00262F741F|nr:ATP-binding protein [uncultured Prevotella sp.]